MSEYQLYCFAQSGNAYRAALMLNLIGADWKPIWVDFFGAMVQRTPKFRAEINEMGEAPVLVHGARKLTQSGVILTYLARRSGKFKPEGEDQELEALRWMIFDNQKVNGFLGPLRFGFPALLLLLGFLALAPLGFLLCLERDVRCARVRLLLDGLRRGRQRLGPPQVLSLLR